MIVVPKNQAENVLLAQWACNILGEPLELFGFDRHGTPMFHTMGFSRNDELLCVFIAYHYTKPNIFMAFASKSPRWASKENIRTLGEWLFGQLECKRLTTLTKKRNKRSRKFQEGIGFIPEGKLQKACEDDDLMIYALLKSNHEKWLRKAFNGKETNTSPAS